MLKIRDAEQSDNRALLALTRATSMPGVIGLRIDRDPDFFRLLSLRGPGTVLVQEEEGRIRGCISISHRQAWVAGVRRTLWYVGDMKVHPDHRREGVGAALAVAAFHRLVASRADLLACVVAQGNRRVLSFLEGRFQIPPFKPLGRMTVLMILTSKAGPGRRFQVREARAEEAAQLADLYRGSNLRTHLAPALEEVDWREGIKADPALCQILVAEDGGQVRAVGWLFDVQWAKQHVVTSLPAALSAVTGPLRLLSRFSPAFRLPRPGDTVPLLALRHLGAAEGGIPALRALVRAARSRAHRGGFPFVVYGVHERDPLKEALKGFPRFTMGSEVFLTSLRGNQDVLEEVARGVPVEDYALT